MAREFADESMVQMVEAGGNAHKLDARLNVHFYMGAVQNHEKSALEGRPIFDEKLMISIAIPGQMDIVKRPAWEGDYHRFPKHLEAFKAGTTDAQSGTPLSVWPAITVGQIAELATRHVRTVEQLAAISDVDAQKFMGMNELRQRAKDFIEAAKGTAPLTAMRAEMDAMKLENERLMAQMAEVIAHANKAAATEAKTSKK